MKILLKIFFLTLFLLSCVTGIAQVVPTKEGPKETAKKNAEPVTEPKIEKSSNEDIKLDIDKQDKQDKQDNQDNQDNQDKENKNGTVKQVKSTRPDMSRSRGARPPDIVRPSGSRVPKGVGRPAGAGRHGRR